MAQTMSCHSSFERKQHELWKLRCFYYLEKVLVLLVLQHRLQLFNRCWMVVAIVRVNLETLPLKPIQIFFLFHNKHICDVMQGVYWRVWGRRDRSARHEDVQRRAHLQGRREVEWRSDRCRRCCWRRPWSDGAETFPVESAPSPRNPASDKLNERIPLWTAHNIQRLSSSYHDHISQVLDVLSLSKSNLHDNIGTRSVSRDVRSCVVIVICCDVVFSAGSWLWHRL